MINRRGDTIYAYDRAHHRFYCVLPIGDMLYLADMEFPESPLLLIRLVDLLQDNRFCEVASTREAA